MQHVHEHNIHTPICLQNLFRHFHFLLLDLYRGCGKYDAGLVRHVHPHFRICACTLALTRPCIFPALDALCTLLSHTITTVLAVDLARGRWSARGALLQTTAP